MAKVSALEYTVVHLSWTNWRPLPTCCWAISEVLATWASIKVWLSRYRRGAAKKKIRIRESKVVVENQVRRVQTV